jgi:hypothetical protein
MMLVIVEASLVKVTIAAIISTLSRLPELRKSFALFNGSLSCIVV